MTLCSGSVRDVLRTLVSDRAMEQRVVKRQEPGRRRVPARVVTGLALVVLAVVLAVENRDLVEIRLLVPVVALPLWTALAGMLVIGVIVGLLVGRPRK